MKLVIINGPNLNMLGIREPDKYGGESYEELVGKIRAYCEDCGIEAELYQSNHEGDLVDRIQQAYFDKADGIVINPGAYTHTSIALLDAVKSVTLPTAEVHISNVKEREAFRQVSYIRQGCCFTVMGHGTDGYLEAIDYLKQKLLKEKLLKEKNSEEQLSADGRLAGAAAEEKRFGETSNKIGDDV